MTTLDEIKSLMKSGDIAGAEALCRKALEADPDNIWLKRRYGICRRMQGDEETFRRINDELSPEMLKKQAARRDMYDKLWSALIVALVIVGAVAFKYVLLGVLVVITIMHIIGYFLVKDSFCRYRYKIGLLLWAAITGIFAFFAFCHQILNGFKWVAHGCDLAPNVMLEVEPAGTNIVESVTTNSSDGLIEQPSQTESETP